MRWIRVATLALVVAACLAQDSETPQEVDPEEVDEEGNTRRDKASQYSYCESDNCYDILGVTKTSKMPAIKRKYRAFAAEYHPDKNPDPAAKEKFQRYARAYQVLSDTEMRKNYDYVLDHPMEFPMFYLRYGGGGTYQAKSDVRMVLFLIIAGISGVQILFKKQQRLNILNGAKTTRSYSERLKTLTAEFSKSASPARPASGSSKSKKDAKKGDDEAKTKAEAKLLEELEEQLPVEPTYKDTFAFTIFTLPLTSCYSMAANTSWVVQFKILGKEYGPEEQDYLTGKLLGYTADEWARVADDEKQALVEQELWIAENKAAFDAVEKEANKGVFRSGKEKRVLRQKKKPSEGMVGMD